MYCQYAHNHFFSFCSVFVPDSKLIWCHGSLFIRVGCCLHSHGSRFRMAPHMPKKWIRSVPPAFCHQHGHDRPHFGSLVELWESSIPLGSVNHEYSISCLWFLVTYSDLKRPLHMGALSENLANQIDRVGSISRYRLTAILALVKIFRCTLEFETGAEWNRKNRWPSR